MQLTTQYTNSGVTAMAYRSQSISNLPMDSYDLLVLTSSWDSRCKSICGIGRLQILRCVFICFDEVDEYDHKKNNDEILNEWLKLNFDKITEISGKIVDVNIIFEKVFGNIVDLYRELGRPLNILFDLSTCPIYIPLSILSKGFDLGIIKKIDYLYGECTYPDTEIGLIGNNEVLFTSGEWTTLEIDSMLGNYEPNRKNQLCVSIGFEGNKTLRVVNKEDPDSLIILLPDPGFDDSYVNRVTSANSELFRSEDITEQEIIHATAGDAIETWRKLDIGLLPFSSEFNQKLLCAGTKPHALGMTLLGITNRGIAILYSKPQEHRYVEVVPKNIYWLYKLESLTAPI